jgi:hypothetical protein
MSRFNVGLTVSLAIVAAILFVKGSVNVMGWSEYDRSMIPGAFFFGFAIAYCWLREDHK